MSAFLIQLIVSILRAFVPAAFEGAKPKMQVGDAQIKERSALRDSIETTWGKHLLMIIMLGSLSGCLFTETIYIPYGTPVRLRETVKDIKVWIIDKDGNKVASKMDLPNGWFCLPYPEKKKK